MPAYDTPVPNAVLFSDRHRCPDWQTALAHAPSGCGLILRDYDAPDRAALAAPMADFCRREGRFFAIAGDRRLAGLLGTAFHCPSYLLRHPLRRAPTGQPSRKAGRAVGRFDTAAVHTPCDLRRAAMAGFQWVFISPVFATNSHQGGRPLTPLRARVLAQAARHMHLTPLALGGMTPTRLRRLNGTGQLWHGFGAIDAFAR